LSASPEYRSLCPTAEPLRVKQSPVIVVPEQAKLEIKADIDALARIRTVANDIPKTKDPRHTLRPDVGEHCIQGFEITVNIAQDGNALVVRHRRSYRAGELSAGWSPGPI
jgi:hypothetical protein